MKNAFLFMRYFLDPRMKADDVKFDQQIKAFSSLGYKVTYLGLGLDGIYEIKGDQCNKICKLYFQYLPIIKKIFQYIALNYGAILLMKKSSFDVAYIRSMSAFPLYPNAIASISKNSIHTIMEIPTFPQSKEIKTDRRWWRFFIHSIMNYYAKSVPNYVDLYALIGEQADTYLGRPAINIENGVDVYQFPVKKWTAHPGEIHILALAKMARWHGFDRVIEGINNYYAGIPQKKIILHLVGPEGDGSLTAWKELADKYQLPEYIRFEGAKYGKDLDAMFDLCDVAIDSLGCYRKKCTTSSSLKVSEYVTRGIPFVISVTDHRLPNNADWLWTAPNDPSPIDIHELISFVERISSIDDISEQMHDYAVMNMGWENQINKLLAFFEEK